MKLIDADALKKAMDGYWGRCQRIRKPRNGETAVFLDVRATVEKQPTVDAVPIKWLTAQAENPSNSDELRNAIDYIAYTLWAERKEE